MTSQEYQERKAQYLRAVFDAIPLPAFIVDGDVRIHDFNTAAEQFLGPEPATALHLRGGEAIHCIHSEPSGCGQAAFCEQCVIRSSVSRVMEAQSTCRELHCAELRTAAGVRPIQLLVTTALLPYTAPPKALLLLEGVTQNPAGAKARRGRRGRTA
jgi:PAS domain-containing protein